MTERPYDIEITRVFDAPPERVYQAFTDPDSSPGGTASRVASDTARSVRASPRLGYADSRGSRRGVGRTTPVPQRGSSCS
jgi:hypothetical protein